jgi:hypothetical protein
VTWRRILTRPPILLKRRSAGFLLEWQNTAAEEAIASQKNILKKIKEGVDIGIRSYKFIRPDSDLGQRVGNVLRRSASSTRTSTRWCRHPKKVVATSNGNMGWLTASAATGNDL